MPRGALGHRDLSPCCRRQTGIPVKEYVKAAKDTEGIGLPKEADGKVEGWLFPSSYEFPEKATAKQQLKAMVAQTVKVLDEAGVAEKDRQKVLTLASLVEAEAKLDVDRPKIARVFLNRVETDGPPAYGLIQSDAAVSYGAKRRSLFPTKAELNDASNPYNTRIHPGLPPGPDQQPRRGLDRRGGQPGRRPVVLLRRGQPDHRRDQVRHDPGRAQRQRGRAERLLQGQTAGLRSVRAAVLGSPITHSLSPALHRAGYAAAGLTGWEYDAHEVDADGLAGFVARPG